MASRKWWSMVHRADAQLSACHDGATMEVTEAGWHDSPLLITGTLQLALPRFPRPWVFPKHCVALRNVASRHSGYHYKPIKFCGVWMWQPNYLALLPADVFRLLSTHVEPLELAELRRTFGATAKRLPPMRFHDFTLDAYREAFLHEQEEEEHYAHYRHRARALTRNYF
jgi:hypothetical protein